MNATMIRFFLILTLLPAAMLGMVSLANGALLEQPSQVTHPAPAAGNPQEDEPALQPHPAEAVKVTAEYGIRPSSSAAPSAAKPARQPLAQVDMDDAYHSQVTETRLRNACGPTSLLMVLDHFDLEDSLEKVIQKSRFSPKQGGFDPACKDNKVCMSPEALAKVAAEAYGIQVETRYGWTLELLYEALSTGRPVIADILWRQGTNGTGHFVVIYGVDLANEIVFYHDPFDGARQEASWKEFSAAWHTIVDAGDPLQPAGHNGWGMAMGRK
jgi:uncharacterized protein YvpB